MTRIVILLAVTLALAACGGSRYSSNKTYGGRSAPVLFATGPLQQACQSDRRKAASRARCGCIQAVANRELSNIDQKRGAAMFQNPHRLQEIRQSNNSANERFWRAWKAYGQTAAQLCANT